MKEGRAEESNKVQLLIREEVKMGLIVYQLHKKCPMRRDSHRKVLLRILKVKSHFIYVICMCSQYWENERLCISFSVAKALHFDRKANVNLLTKSQWDVTGKTKL